MKLMDFINDNYIHIQLSPKNKVELIEQMVDHLLKLHPEISKKNLLENLLQRENENSTGIGNQIAIPHTIDKNIKKTVCLIGQIPAGVEFDSMDNKKVLLAFMLVSPPGLMSEHIRLLSRIARLCKEPHMVESLSKSSKEEIIKLISQEDSKQD